MPITAWWNLKCAGVSTRMIVRKASVLVVMLGKARSSCPLWSCRHMLSEDLLFAHPCASPGWVQVM